MGLIQRKSPIHGGKKAPANSHSLGLNRYPLLCCHSLLIDFSNFDATDFSLFAVRFCAVRTTNYSLSIYSLTLKRVPTRRWLEYTCLGQVVSDPRLLLIGIDTQYSKPAPSIIKSCFIFDASPLLLTSAPATLGFKSKNYF